MIKKEAEVLIVYGFHPFERFAFNVGKSLSNLNIQHANVVKFIPRSITSNYLKKERKDQLLEHSKALKELKRFVKRNFRKSKLITVLHSFPFICRDEEAGEKELLYRYLIIVPACNKELIEVLEKYCRYFNRKERRHAYVLTESLRRMISYNQADVEFYPYIISRCGKVDRLHLKKAINFIKNLVLFLQRHFLR